MQTIEQQAQARLGQLWFVVAPPHGDGTVIHAGRSDGLGEFVLECAALDEHDSPFTGSGARALAWHIAAAHNAMFLALERLNNGG